MKTRQISAVAVAAAVWVPVMPVMASAQASAPVPSLSASAVLPARPGPRLMTPAEKRDNANEAASPDLRLDRPVAPQISVPLGRTPPGPTPSETRAVRRGTSANGIDDAAAKCDADAVGERARIKCREQLATPPQPR